MKTVLIQATIRFSAIAIFCNLSAMAAEPTTLDLDTLTAKINAHLLADWTENDIKPAPQSSDAEFLRRVTLDLIGRIPTLSELETFISDTSPKKRQAIVRKLMDNSLHAMKVAERLRADWLPRTITDQQSQIFGTQFESWLSGQLTNNIPIDKIARQVVGVELQLDLTTRFRYRAANDTDAPLAAFYAAQEYKPEEVASTVSRIFLGTKLECAQCHDHPFAPHTKEQFWQLGAFFSEFSPLPPVAPSFVGPLPPQYRLNQITIPNTELNVSATYFNGETPVWTSKTIPRTELSLWLTSPENEWFARNQANRLWQTYLGFGLIDPIDEPGENNPPSHPELLDDLTAALIAAKFDLKFVTEAILASEAYQVTSRITHPSQSDSRRYAKFTPRSLSGTDLFHSFSTATGLRSNGPDAQLANSQRTLLQAAFPIQKRALDSRTSILQALRMMNGELMSHQTKIETSHTLAAIVDAPYLTTERQVELMFESTLTRLPTAEERERFASYVDRGGPSQKKSAALADLYWILLNSTEFSVNH